MPFCAASLTTPCTLLSRRSLSGVSSLPYNSSIKKTPTDSQISMLGQNRLAIPLLFGLGFCALIYQTTWLREFRLTFGASTAATAVVVGVFMAGLGFGGIVLGRRSESQAQPLAFYAKLELLIALSASVSPILIFAARYAYIALGGTGTLGLFFGTVFRLILAALIMGAPTFLMGGTLPAVARAVVRPADVGRRSIGILYGFNTLGAVVGAAVGTFFCFENLGNRLTLWLAALLNIGIALAAFQLSKRIVDVKSGPATVSKPLPEHTAGSVNPKFVLAAAGHRRFCVFFDGACMGTECWHRFWAGRRFRFR